MNRKKTFLFLLIIVCSVVTVRADFPTSIVVSRDAENFKATPDGKYLFCISGPTVASPSSGVICTLELEWTNSQNAYGIGYILDHFSKLNITGTIKPYTYIQAGIFAYLGKEYDTRTANTVIGGTNERVVDIVQDAKTYANNIVDAEITANGKKSLKLTFTYDESDGYYKSQIITISSNTNYTLKKPNNSKFEYISTGDNKYQFRIKQSDIVPGTEETFTSKTTVSKKYVKAAMYNCKGNSSGVNIYGERIDFSSEDVQDLTLADTEEETRKAYLTLSGTVLNENSSLAVVSKKSIIDESELPGATLEITNEDGSSVECQMKNDSDELVTKVPCRWESTDESQYIYGLAEGAYVLKEISAPKGYLLNTNQIRFEMVNGKTKINDDVDTIIEMTNDLEKVYVGKLDEFGNIMKGAKIQVLDANKNVMPCILKSSGKYVTQSKCTWTSNSKRYVYGLPDGKYYLKETYTPDGYTMNNQNFEFTIQDGKIIGNVDNEFGKVDGTNNSVYLKNKISNVTISKKDITNNTELPGAKLKLVNNLKAEISCKEKVNGELQTIEKCEWTSGTVPKVIYGLPDGTYYLKEITEPNGYILNTEEVSFDVSDGIVNETVVMTNKIRSVKISKKGVSGIEDLAGAKLEILNINKESINCKMDENNAIVDKDKCEWLSKNIPTTIYGLSDGKYYLKEISAPNGYKTSDELMEFEIINGEAPMQIMYNQILVKPTAYDKSSVTTIVAILSLVVGVGAIVYYQKKVLV